MERGRFPPLALIFSFWERGGTGACAACFRKSPTRNIPSILILFLLFSFPQPNIHHFLWNCAACYAYLNANRRTSKRHPAKVVKNWSSNAHEHFHAVAELISYCRQDHSTPIWTRKLGGVACVHEPIADRLQLFRAPLQTGALECCAKRRLTREGHALWRCNDQATRDVLRLLRQNHIPAQLRSVGVLAKPSPSTLLPNATRNDPASKKATNSS